MCRNAKLGGLGCAGKKVYLTAEFGRFNEGMADDAADRQGLRALEGFEFYVTALQAAGQGGGEVFYRNLVRVWPITGLQRGFVEMLIAIVGSDNQRTQAPVGFAGLPEVYAQRRHRIDAGHAGYGFDLFQQTDVGIAPQYQIDMRGLRLPMRGIHFAQQQIDHAEQGADAADASRDTDNSQRGAAFSQPQVGPDFIPERIQTRFTGLLSAWIRPERISSLRLAASARVSLWVTITKVLP